jgi:hypothetical protein
MFGYIFSYGVYLVSHSIATRVLRLQRHHCLVVDLSPIYIVVVAVVVDVYFLLTGLQLMPHICGMKMGSFFKGAYFPQKLTPKSSINTEYKLFQKHVPSY